MYEMSVDKLQKLVRVKFSGLLTLEEVIRYRRDRDAAAVSMGGITASYALLADLTEMDIQPLEITNEFLRILREVRGTRRIAAAVGTVLSKLQIKYALAGEDVAIFGTTDEAEAWLLHEDKRLAS